MRNSLKDLKLKHRLYFNFERCERRRTARRRAQRFENVPNRVYRNLEMIAEILIAMPRTTATRRWQMITINMTKLGRFSSTSASPLLGANKE